MAMPPRTGSADFHFKFTCGPFGVVGEINFRYIGDCIGVSRRSAAETQTIRFRVYEPHKNYIKTLPIHHSQALIVDEGEYAEFVARVAPTEESFIEMLQGGSWIEVLSPDEVVDEMKQWVKDLYNVYFNK